MNTHEQPDQNQKQEVMPVIEITSSLKKVLVAGALGVMALSSCSVEGESAGSGADEINQLDDESLRAEQASGQLDEVSLWVEEVSELRNGLEHFIPDDIEEASKEVSEFLALFENAEIKKAAVLQADIELANRSSSESILGYGLEDFRFAADLRTLINDDELAAATGDYFDYHAYDHAGSMLRQISGHDTTESVDEVLELVKLINDDEVKGQVEVIVDAGIVLELIDLYKSGRIELPEYQELLQKVEDEQIARFGQVFSPEMNSDAEELLVGDIIAIKEANELKLVELGVGYYETDTGLLRATNTARKKLGEVLDEGKSKIGNSGEIIPVEDFSIEANYDGSNIIDLSIDGSKLVEVGGFDSGEILRQFGKVDVQNGVPVFSSVEEGVISELAETQIADVVRTYQDLISLSLSEGNSSAIIFTVNKGEHFPKAYFEGFGDAVVIELDDTDENQTMEQLGITLTHELMHSFEANAELTEKQYYDYVSVCDNIATSAAERLGRWHDPEDPAIGQLGRYIHPDARELAISSFKEIVIEGSSESALIDLELDRYVYPSPENDTHPSYVQPQNCSVNSNIVQVLYSSYVEGLKLEKRKGNDTVVEVSHSEFWQGVDGTEEEAAMANDVLDSWDLIQSYLVISRQLNESNFLSSDTRLAEHIGHAQDNTGELIASSMTVLINYPEELKELLNDLGEEEKTEAYAMYEAFSNVLVEENPEMEDYLNARLALVTKGEVQVSSDDDDIEAIAGEALDAAYDGDITQVLTIASTIDDNDASGDIVERIFEIQDKKLYR